MRSDLFNNSPKPVVVEGTKYPSLNAAARAVYIERKALRDAANGLTKEPTVQATWA